MECVHMPKTVALPQCVVGSTSNRSSTFFGTFTAMVPHDNEVRRTAQRGALGALRTEVNRVHSLMQNIVDSIAAAVNKCQRVKRIGDFCYKFAVKLSLQGLVSPRSRLKIGDIYKKKEEKKKSALLLFIFYISVKHYLCMHGTH